MRASAATSRTPDPDVGASWTVLGQTPDGEGGVLLDLDENAAILRRVRGARDDLSELVRERGDRTRWVWTDTRAWYPALLSHGVRVARCHDLRLCRPLDGTPTSGAIAHAETPHAGTAPAEPALFEWHERQDPRASADAALTEFERQRDAVGRSRHPDRLRLLHAAESAGALIACEMTAAGVPWDRARHEAILVEVLGAPGARGAPPARVQAAADRVRMILAEPRLHVDSPAQLLRALRRAGVEVSSTSRWELAGREHPVIEPLLEYKRLARLWTANGWSWLDEWVRDGRFRPVYIPAGVVTGRWASAGGGALQIPRQLRPAVRADPGWALVSADVAQLEPRVLAGMSGDRALARAARGADLYEGLVAGGVMTSRQEAKIALLGAMYGATTGRSGQLVPALRRAFPRAMALVDAAARAGERGESVSTRLGRASPPTVELLRPPEDDVEGVSSDQRRRLRDHGRFTRNFIVQGTAAEWALCWMAGVRTRLRELPVVGGAPQAAASGAVFGSVPHLAFFLHDELIVHTPREHADAVARILSDAAHDAGRLLFGDFPIDFPLDLHVEEAARTS